MKIFFHKTIIEKCDHEKKFLGANAKLYDYKKYVMLLTNHKNGIRDHCTWCNI